MQKELYLPVAVVIGCGLIGAGLFLGLRSSGTPPPPPGAVTASRPADTAAATSPPPAGAPGTARATPRRDTSRAEQTARALIENER